MPLTCSYVLRGVIWDGRRPLTCMASVIASGLFPGAVRVGPCFTGSLGSAATAGRELTEGRDAWLVRCLSCRSWVARFRGGTRAARGCQAYLGPRALQRARDMMIDWA